MTFFAVGNGFLRVRHVLANDNTCVDIPSQSLVTTGQETPGVGGPDNPHSHRQCK